MNVNEVYKPTDNLGAPSCRKIKFLIVSPRKVVMFYGSSWSVMANFYQFFVSITPITTGSQARPHFALAGHRWFHPITGLFQRETWNCWNGMGPKHCQISWGSNKLYITVCLKMLKISIFSQSLSENVATPAVWIGNLCSAIQFWGALFSDICDRWCYMGFSQKRQVQHLQHLQNQPQPGLRDLSAKVTTLNVCASLRASSPPNVVTVPLLSPLAGGWIVVAHGISWVFSDMTCAQVTIQKTNPLIAKCWNVISIHFNIVQY